MCYLNYFTTITLLKDAKIVTIQRKYRSTVDYACDNKFCPLKCLIICYFLSEIGMFLFAHIRYFLYLYAYETTGY